MIWKCVIFIVESMLLRHLVRGRRVIRECLHRREEGAGKECIIDLDKNYEYPLENFR